MTDLNLYAAGSLRSAFTALIDKFTAATGIGVAPTYGPSGVLRQNIEKGEAVDIFASANMEHPLALQGQHLLQNTTVFASNHLCLLAAPGVPIDRGRLLDTLLDPSLRLATSTPDRDPMGDYTWMLFRKAEQLRPGAYDALDRKAQKLLGQPASDGRPIGVLELFSAPPKSDLMIAYASYGELAARQVPGTSWVPFPPELDVASRFGIGMSPDADARAGQFIRFVLGADGAAILRQHGFGPPG